MSCRAVSTSASVIYLVDYALDQHAGDEYVVADIDPASSSFAVELPEDFEGCLPNGYHNRSRPNRPRSCNPIG